MDNSVRNKPEYAVRRLYCGHVVVFTVIEVLFSRDDDDGSLRR